MHNYICFQTQWLRACSLADMPVLSQLFVSCQAYKVALESLGHCEYAMKAGFHLNPKAIEASLQVGSAKPALSFIPPHLENNYLKKKKKKRLILGFLMSPFLLIDLLVYISGLLQWSWSPANRKETDSTSANSVWTAHCTCPDRIAFSERNILQWVCSRKPEAENGNNPGSNHRRAVGWGGEKKYKIRVELLKIQGTTAVEVQCQTCI